jgi:HK97 family phage major capsid protein
MENIKEMLSGELSRVKSEIDSLLVKANEEIKNDVSGLRTETKSQLETLTTKFNTDLEKAEKARSEQQKQLDDIAAMQKEAARFQKEKGNRKKSTAELMIDAFSIEENFNRVKDFSRNRNVNIEVRKAAAVMTPSANWTGEVAPPDRNDEVIFDPRTDAIPASALIRNFTATGDLVKYIQETVLENYTAVVAAGGTKPRSATKLETKSKEIIKLATEMTFAEEMLSDFAQYGPYISVTLQDLLQEKKNQEILYGVGGSGQIEGLTQFASAYVPKAFGVNVTSFDVLMRAVTQIRTARYAPSWICLNPEDYLSVISEKTSDGDYHFGAFIFGTNQPNIMGVPIIQHNTMAPGDFLVGTRNGASLWDRMAINVRFYDQHAENATKNLITAVCETRLTLTPERPNAFVYGDFASAKSASSGTV